MNRRDCAIFICKQQFIIFKNLFAPLILIIKKVLAPLQLIKEKVVAPLENKQNTNIKT
jgi:hypothetical protein